MKKRVFSFGNFFLKKRRGFSAIVISLFIILVALIIVGGSWMVIKKNISTEDKNETEGITNDCEPESPETTCGTWLCGIKTNNCGAKIECPPGCEKGQMCNNGTCIEITAVNTGIVEDTWPGESAMYFGSSDLPVDISYEDYYIKFPGSEEIDCLLISIYKFPPEEGYDKSHIGFNFETSIKTGDNYQIWETQEECEA